MTRFLLPALMLLAGVAGGVLIARFKEIFHLVYESFTDDGRGSAGRFAMWTVVVTWSAIALLNRAIPERTLEVTIMACGFYNATKLAELAAVIAAWRSGAPLPPPPAGGANPQAH